MRIALPLLLALLLIGGPLTGPASAQQVNAPPGLSGVDEYLETVPGAEGAERPGAGDDSGRPLNPDEIESRSAAALPEGTARELDRAGKDGAELKRLVAANSPRVAGVDAGAVAGQALRDSGSTGAAGSITAVLTGGAGAGIVFPLGLLALTVALVVAGLRRRRASS